MDTGFVILPPKAKSNVNTWKLTKWNFKLKGEKKSNKPQYRCFQMTSAWNVKRREASLNHSAVFGTS